MKTTSEALFATWYSAVILRCLLVGLIGVIVQPVAAETKSGSLMTAPRNIVFIMLDDADYFDFGFTNQTLKSPDIVTPNIDRLRAGGRLMTQYYCASSICSPTRASILTGNNPIQHGATEAWVTSERVSQAEPGMTGLPRHIPQLGSAMKLQGLRTAHFGKWHVGFHRPEFRPDALGWDHYLVHFFPKSHSKDNWTGRFRFITEDEVYVRKVDNLDSYFAEQVRKFIAASVARNERFCVNFWPLTPHKPWAVPKDFDNSTTKFDLHSDRGKLMAMMNVLDRDIGLIVDQLTELGIIDETLIMVTSDNGGQSSVQHPEHLRGAKASLFEGGISVPLVAHWPAAIEAGSENDSLFLSYDLMPTLVDLLKGDPSVMYSSIDGRSKAAALTSNVVLSHEPVVWQLAGGPRRIENERSLRYFAYRDGDHKLVKVRRYDDLTQPNAYLLFDVANDRVESKKLNRTEPELLDVMKREMLSMRKSRSRFDDVPEVIETRSHTMQFDPRLDVNSKDMTLTMTISVPDKLSKTQNIFWRPGAQRLVLTPDGQLRWRLLGMSKRRKRNSSVLVAPSIKPGEHEVVLRIGGWKTDMVRAELVVDGKVVDQLDQPQAPSPMLTIRHSARETILGDQAIKLSAVRYYNNYFYDDELSP
ncbi:Arylsulfatase [Rubripirellula amarantea]|uniref:Arylsulfatase n=1 Tax=Rubripirellula amarantea TaxID=2527999 RepID=A0A5C5WBV6_9BACT|nr:sulfatase-like hydrolase/transferase [Rubripirellula amarantea]TWT48124.1 Arylsulfatase [Rubripirellula amarantea]